MLSALQRFVILLTLILFGSIAAAGDLERRQAKRIHDRIAGIPPAAGVLDDMEADIMAGNATAAASRAMENSAFYSVTLKNFAAPWTNRSQTLFTPLNDYTATVIGMIRDELPFTDVLSADLVYIGAPGLGLPLYSMNNNAHYDQLEEQGIDLKDNLVPVAQSAVTSLPPAATAGVMTTRAAAEAFFVAGTNRAMFRFTLMNHLCNDLEQVKDITRSPDRIRQDVSRSPGGDSRIFMNSCIGCHSGMDPMAQAFAYYNFNTTSGSIEYTPGVVQPKYHINADTFKHGYVTPDDQWVNYWRNGQNALLGWDTGLPGLGSGAKSLGVELARTEAFAACQVTKVFRTVCLREPGNAADRGQIDSMTAAFKADNYNMKTAFSEAAVYCMGD
ncbi:MAG: hypothetical protein JSU75_06180 [Gammaproteobacteria bacterium]|nr:MAG: hypothetical protein JSU75_06180 [Gammaproteobacteria bacterium]